MAVYGCKLWTTTSSPYDERNADRRLCVSPVLLEVLNLKQPVPLECCITDSNGPLAEWDLEHAGEIDCYDVQCHCQPNGTAVMVNVSCQCTVWGLLALVGALSLIHPRARLQVHVAHLYPVTFVATSSYCILNSFSFFFLVLH